MVELPAQVRAEPNPELPLISALQRDLRRPDHDLDGERARPSGHITQLSSFFVRQSSCRRRGRFVVGGHVSWRGRASPATLTGRKPRPGHERPRDRDARDLLGRHYARVSLEDHEVSPLSHRQTSATSLLPAGDGASHGVGVKGFLDGDRLFGERSVCLRDPSGSLPSGCPEAGDHRERRGVRAERHVQAASNHRTNGVGSRQVVVRQVAAEVHSERVQEHRLSGGHGADPSGSLDLQAIGKAEVLEPMAPASLLVKPLVRGEDGIDCRVPDGVRANTEPAR